MTLNDQRRKNSNTPYECNPFSMPAFIRLQTSGMNLQSHWKSFQNKPSQSSINSEIEIDLQHGLFLSYVSLSRTLVGIGSNHSIKPHPRQHSIFDKSNLLDSIAGNETAPTSRVSSWHTDVPSTNDRHSPRKQTELMDDHLVCV